VSSAQPTFATIPDPTDATSGQDVLPLSVTYTGTGLNRPLCVTLWDYASIECVLTGFSILRSQLVQSVFGVQAYDADQSSVQRVSNILTTTRLTYKRLTNWNGASEDVRMLRIVGSGSSQRVIFEGRTVTGTQPQVFAYSPQSDTVERVTWGSSFHVNTQNPSFNMIDNKIYGRIRTNTNLTKGFIYDADAATVTIFTNTAGSTLSDNVHTFTAFENRVFFSAENPSRVRKLYFYDAGSNQIWQLMNLNGATVHDLPTSMTSTIFPVVGGKMYFVAEAGAGNQKIFSYDGGSGLNQVTNLVSGSTDEPTLLTPWGSRLCFAAFAAPAIRKLYCYDSSTLTQVSNTAGSGVSDVVSQVVADGSLALYYVAEVSAGIKKLFRYDGSSNRRLGDTSGSPTSSDNPASLFIHQGKLYFSALGTDGYSLFEYNPNANTLVRVFRTALTDTASMPTPLASYNGKLYFSAPKALGIRKLYMFDGSATLQVADTHPAGSDDPRNLWVLGNLLYFSSRTAATSQAFSLWALCDPSAGCSL